MRCATCKREGHQRRTSVKCPENKKSLVLKALRPYVEGEANSEEPGFVTQHYLGKMDQQCPHCDALMFKCESTAKDHGHQLFGLCCGKGKVHLEPYKELPEEIKNLLDGENTSAEAQFFRKHLRQFNNSFAFVSTSGKLSVTGGGGPQVVQLQGGLVHRIAEFRPGIDIAGLPRTPQYAQVYILDNSEQANIRLENSGLHNRRTLEGQQQLLEKVQDAILRVNEYAEVYHTAEERKKQLEQEGNPAPDVRILFRAAPHGKERTHNPPAAEDVAMIVIAGVDGDEETVKGRDIYVSAKGGVGNLQRIDELHQSVDALSFPLMFPSSDPGYNTEMKHRTPPSLGGGDQQGPANAQGNVGMAEQDWDAQDGNGRENLEGEGQQPRKKRNKLTPAEYYKYRLMRRLPVEVKSHPLLYKLILQQWIVEAYHKIEVDRLRYIRFKLQPKLRAYHIKGLLDAIRAGETGDFSKFGRRYILPSSFLGSNRDRQARLQDALALARRFKGADLFITMTCNPKWREITESLEKGQKASDRPDIVVRVFHQKLQALLKELDEGQIFGKALAVVHVVEFQKRGLPHAHILLTLAPEDRPQTTDDYDKIITSELPDKDTEPELYDIVTQNMLHGPCGARCQKNGRCTKG